MYHGLAFILKIEIMFLNSYFYFHFSPLTKS